MMFTIGAIGVLVRRSPLIILLSVEIAEEHSKHWFGNMRTEVQGNRAIQETDVQVLIRAYIDGVLFDNTSWARFYDRFEKRDGAWKILQMTCIYEKDRLDPVVPGTAPAGFYEGVPLKGEAAASAYLAFRLAKVGRKSIPMVFARSAEERALKDEGQRWLAGA